jgi:DNA-binding MarR family transcriptional regulator
MEQTLQRSASFSHFNDLLLEVRSLGNWLKQAQFGGDHASLSAGIGILQLIAQQGPQSVPQLARLRGTSRQNIQVLVNRLSADGWITLAPNPAHQRSPLASLTDQAKERLSGMTKPAFESSVATVSVAEMELAVSVLRRIQASLTGRTTTNQGALSRVPAPKPRRSPARADRRLRPPNPVPATPQLDDWIPGSEGLTGESELPVNLL